MSDLTADGLRTLLLDAIRGERDGTTIPVPVEDCRRIAELLAPPPPGTVTVNADDLRRYLYEYASDPAVGAARDRLIAELAKVTS